ncbi:MAG: hypothetical protein WCJ87_07220 [Burkholderiales bacterium]
MFNTSKIGLLVVVTALTLMPAVSAASLVSAASTPGRDTPKLPDALAPIASQSSGPASVPGISFNADFALPQFVPLVAVPRNPPPGGQRRSVDPSLWNLVAAVNAQQSGDSFRLVEATVASLPVSPTNVDPLLSAVPLPPAVWLFVMGLLGLAGTRITGMAGRSSRAGSPAPARNRSTGFGRALPA